jgi:hypothetical protein
MLRQSCLTLSAGNTYASPLGIQHAKRLIIKERPGLGNPGLVYIDNAAAIRVINSIPYLVCIARFHFAFQHHCAYSYNMFGIVHKSIAYAM